MNKVFYLTLFLLVATMLFGCRKDEPLVPLRLVQTETFSNGDHATYEYNSEGKLSKKTENVGSAFGVLNTYDITSTYSYTHDTIKVAKVSLGFDGSSHTTSKNYEIHILNSQGYISKSTYSIQGSSFSTICTYEYDKDGNLTKEIQTLGPDTYITTNTYFSGNMISTISNYGSLVNNCTYEYYTDKINLLNQDHYGFNYMGKDNKNLIKTGNLVLSNNTHYNFSYQYEFDQYGYVSKKTTVSNSNTEWVSYTYK